MIDEVHHLMLGHNVFKMLNFQFPLMTYACERTNAIVFKELRKRVKQVKFTPVRYQ